ncbi:hypothetical protein CHLNCDRAFT_28040, partial [Chlorella variabilis]
RLVNGTTPASGRVEVLVSGEWRPVCGYTFGPRAAAIVCRQLGFVGGSIISTSDAYSMPNVNVVWESLNCTGEEASILDCTFPTGYRSWSGGLYSGGPRKELGVECFPDGAVRLLNGSVPNEGRLELLHAGQWWPVCRDSFQGRAAWAACRSLGYARGLAEGPYSNSYFRAMGTATWDGLSCLGGESSLFDCYSGPGPFGSGTDQELGVACFNETGEAVGSTGPLASGRVEVLRYGQWRPVCSSGFGPRAAAVACRQAGWLGGTAAVAPPVPFDTQDGTSNTVFLFGDNSCSPDSGSLLECGFEYTTCSGEAAAVTCTDSPGARQCLAVGFHTSKCGIPAAADSWQAKGKKGKGGEEPPQA